jgi:hypothetical protein
MTVALVPAAHPGLGVLCGKSAVGPNRSHIQGFTAGGTPIADHRSLTGGSSPSAEPLFTGAAHEAVAEPTGGPTLRHGRQLDVKALIGLSEVWIIPLRRCSKRLAAGQRPYRTVSFTLLLLPHQPTVITLSAIVRCLDLQAPR